MNYTYVMIALFIICSNLYNLCAVDDLPLLPNLITDPPSITLHRLTSIHWIPPIAFLMHTSTNLSFVRWK